MILSPFSKFDSSPCVIKTRSSTLDSFPQFPPQLFTTDNERIKIIMASAPDSSSVPGKSASGSSSAPDRSSASAPLLANVSLDVQADPLQGEYAALMILTIGIPTQPVPSMMGPRFQTFWTRRMMTRHSLSLLRRPEGPHQLSRVSRLPDVTLNSPPMLFDAI